MKIDFAIILLSLCFAVVLTAQNSTEFTYKTIDDVALKMVVYTPSDLRAEEKKPAIIFFFGGGWETGNKTQFQYYALNYAKKGIITVLADYRISSVHGTTPFESLKDAKSAVRYLKQHADELQIDDASDCFRRFCRRTFGGCLLYQRNNQ